MAQFSIACAGELGLWADAEELLEEYSDLLSDPAERGALARGWGLVLTRQGRCDEARPLVDAAVAELDTWGGEDPGWIASAVVQFDMLEGRFAAAADRVARVLQGRPMSSWGDVELVAAAAAALADGLLAAAPGSERSAAAGMAARVAGSWIEQLEYAEPAPWRTDAISAIRIEEAKAHVAVLRGQPDPVRWSRIADQWAMFEHPWEEANARMRAGAAWLAGTAGRGLVLPPRRRGGTSPGVGDRCHARRPPAAGRHRRAPPAGRAGRRRRTRCRAAAVGRGLRSHPPGARRPTVARRRTDQRADRPRVVHQHEDGERARLCHLAKSVSPIASKQRRSPAARTGARPARRPVTGRLAS